MLLVNSRKSASRITSYHFGRRPNGEHASRAFWGGRGAKFLGVGGRVDKGAFAALCRNLHPGSGERLTARTKSNRTVGYEFNFNVPKSVSVVYRLAGDKRIPTKVDECIVETMQEVERHAATRVRRGDVKDGDRPTGNLIWVKFRHTLARPKDGVPDPHIHDHVFVFNATLDGVENKWKAGQFREIVREAPYFEADFLNRLARKLRGLGYEVVRRGRAFEIRGVPESAIRKFSQRTKQIEEEAVRRGITNPAAKAKLGVITREPKGRQIPDSRLLAQYVRRLTPTEWEAIEKLKGVWQGERQRAKDASTTRITESDAIDFALRQHFERQSVVPKRRLLESALRHAIGEVDSEKLLAEFWRRVEAKEIICKEVQGRLLVTMPEIVAEEKFIMGWANQIAPALAPRHVVADSRLNAEQRQAVEQVLTSTSRVVGVIGKAGTGKTTLMREAIAAIRSQGGQVVVMTPHSEHAYQRLRQDGFKDAVTVEAFLRNETMREQFRNAVLWIDEAGLLSNRTMQRLFEVADEIDARIVLAGDHGQHGPVERGTPFKLLRESGDVPFATLSEIQRQHGQNREVVEHLAEGRTEKGFNLLDALGQIHELDGARRYNAVAREYVRSLDADQSVLAIAPTHWEGRKVTEAIRRKLKASGKLGQEQTLPVLRRLDWSKAERADASSYYSGLVIETTQNAGGFERGERLEVVDEPAATEANCVTVRVASGVLGAFNVTQLAERFQIFERDELRVGLGEVIRITKNGRTLEGRRLNNGSIHTVAGFTPQRELKTKLGIIPREYLHLGYGWVSTSFASQGRTVDKVIIAQSSASGRASNARQFYVSVSRARNSINVFTDNKAALLGSLRTEDEGLSAVELVVGKRRAALVTSASQTMASPMGASSFTCW